MKKWLSDFSNKYKMKYSFDIGKIMYGRGRYKHQINGNRDNSDNDRLVNFIEISISHK